MIKFIKLTEVQGNDIIKTVILNVAAIQCCQIGAKGKDIHIRMLDRSFFFVKESLDEVWEKLKCS